MIGLAAGIAWSAIKRGFGAIARHPWVLAVVAGLWWLLRNRERLQRARAQLDAAKLDAEAQRGRAEVAEASARAAAEVAANQQAGRALAEEIADAAAPAVAPPDRIRLADERVHAIARREGADPGGDRPAAMRDAPAADAARGAGRRDPER